VINKDDLQMLRFAALELQDKDIDLVKVAGVVQKVKNWWKAKFSPEFAEKQEQLEIANSEMKGPMSELLGQLNDFNKSLKNQDVNNVARLTTSLPIALTKAVVALNDLNEKVQDANKSIPTGNIDEKAIRTVQRGYRQDQGMIDQLTAALPEEFKEIPIGQVIDKPITDFKWYATYDPSQIVYNKGGPDFVIKKAIKETLTRRFKFSEQKIEDILNYGFDTFMSNLLSAILSQGKLTEINFANVSDRVTHRRANEMQIEVDAGPVELPTENGNITIHIAGLHLTDKGTAIPRVKQLSLRRVTYLSVLSIDPEVLREDNI
jgi:hypothetical protein